ASYRLMMVQTLDGRFEQAAETHEYLVRQYAVNYDDSGDDDEDGGDDDGGGQDDENTPTPTPSPTPTPLPEFGDNPGVEFAEMADIWWGAFQDTGDQGVACNQVIDYIRDNPLAIDVLNAFGYANREYTAVDVCPFGISS
ncbi:MAG: hypothetical protein ACFB51_08875, partial [Anaerolineae bacterium]